METQLRTMMSRHPDNNDIDLFVTPPLTTLCLLSQKKFGYYVWENACGDGAISKLLAHLNYSVRSTDLYNYGYGESGMDFLEVGWPNYGGTHDIITNPPYNIHIDWIEKSLKWAKRYVALLFPLVYLTPNNKRDFITNRCGFELIVPGWRSAFVMPGKTHAGKMKDYAWYVWDKEKPASKSFRTTIVEKKEVEKFAIENGIEL